MRHCGFSSLRVERLKGLATDSCLPVVCVWTESPQEPGSLASRIRNALALRNQQDVDTESDLRLTCGRCRGRCDQGGASSAARCREQAAAGVAGPGHWSRGALRSDALVSGKLSLWPRQLRRSMVVCTLTCEEM